MLILLSPCGRLSQVLSRLAARPEPRLLAQPGLWPRGHLVHVRFRSSTPLFEGAARSIAPAAAAAHTASSSKRSRRAAPSPRFPPSAVPRSLVLRVATSAPASAVRRSGCWSFRGSKETFGPSKGLLGRRSSGESELLFATANGRSRGATKPSALGVLAAAIDMDSRFRGNDALVARATSRWIQAFAGMTSEPSSEHPAPWAPQQRRK
jgi:hypothetical protein